MLELITDNCCGSLVPLLVVMKNGSAGSDQGLAVESYIERNGINEAQPIDVILFHRSFVPDLVYGFVVNISKNSGGKKKKKIKTVAVF